MKNFIEELEKRNNRQKGEWIKNFLNERKIPFTIQSFKTLLARGENIIVDYPFNQDNTGKKKIFITAHYNAWFRTPGANDNASGVVVMLEFIEKLQNEPKFLPIRFIFFDLEDGWAMLGGSKSYVKEFGVDDVEKIYNIEMVGMGRELLLWPSYLNDRRNEWLEPLVQNAKELGFSMFHLPTPRIVLVSFPTKRGFASDHLSFVKAGCKHVCALTTFPAEDLPYFDKFLQGRQQFRLGLKLLLYLFFKKGTVPKFFRHYHNDEDRSEFIQEENLEKIHKLLWSVI